MMTQQLVTKAGIVYSSGSKWPEACPIAQEGRDYYVGPIFNMSGEEVPLESEGDDDFTGSSQDPPYYEVWGVTKDLMTVLQSDPSKLDMERADPFLRDQVIIRRVVTFDHVAFSDELWAGVDGLIKLHQRSQTVGEAVENERREWQKQATTPTAAGATA